MLTAPAACKLTGCTQNSAHAPHATSPPIISLVMIRFFRVIADCNRFIAANDSVKPITYLVRIGAAWLAAMVFRIIFLGSIVEEEIVFQALLLLLLVSSRIGRFPLNRNTLPIVLILLTMIVGNAWYGSHGLAALKTETPIPVWRAYLYAFLVGMTWMSVLFLWGTIMLCQKHITGTSNYRDIHKILKEKGLVPRISRAHSLVILLFIAFLFLFLRDYLAYYLLYHGAYVWTVRMLATSFLGGALGLVMFMALFRYRNYLKSVGKIDD